MKKFQIRHGFLLLAGALLMCACSASKYLPDDTYMLNKVKVLADGKYKDINPSEMKGYLRQKSNSSWFNIVRVPLGVYAMGGQDSSWVGRTLRSMGEAPIVYDTLLARQTCKDLKMMLQNKGYLDAEVELYLDKKGKKVPLPTLNLFKFELPPLLYTIEGTVRDEKSMQLIKGAKVKIVGSDGSESETYTDKKGHYKFNTSQVKGQVVYKMYFSKVDYFSLEQSESTKGYNVDKDIVHDCRMEPVPQQPVVLPEIRYDLSKWDIQHRRRDHCERNPIKNLSDQNRKRHLYSIHHPLLYLHRC